MNNSFLIILDLLALGVFGFMYIFYLKSFKNNRKRNKYFIAITGIFVLLHFGLRAYERIIV